MRTWKGYWVFIEAENTILNEDPIIAYIYEKMWRKASELGKTITFPRLLAMREALIREKRIGPPYSILGTRLLGKDNWTSTWREIYKDLKKNYRKKIKTLDLMIPFLKELKGSYKVRCCLIARQPRSVTDLVYKMRIKSQFDDLKVNDKVWLYAPDPDVINNMMHKLKTLPEQSILITSRGSEYIREMYETGIKIILYKPRIEAKHWFPKSDNPYGKAYLDSLQRSDLLEIEEEKRSKHISAILSDSRRMMFVISKIIGDLDD
ncbi:MAG: hypothetical protein APR63_13565 [Desulfuromonas sp. SDB]|nr:MAG: hypothetical protein APR63_13565 [Desulfuromonas sp. SDB]